MRDYQKQSASSIKITHKGLWEIIDGVTIECYVTKDERRLMSLRGTARAMNLRGGGSTGLIRNMKAKFLQPYLSDQLKSWIQWASSENVVKIKSISGPAIIPFDVELFGDLCKAYTQANADGILNENQKILANRLLGIMTAFMKLGLTATIDEITGYQKDRQKDDLRKLLKAYVSEELLEWVQMFPDEYFEQLFRLRGWNSFKESDRKMPKVVGLFIRDTLYKRLPDNVFEEIYKKTPKSKAGHKLVRLHQSLTEDVGRKHLENLITTCIGFMKASDSWAEFMYLLDKSYPIKGKQARMWLLMMDG